jgi:uncharacterized repeat protein (TIGR01451 family)
LFVCAFALLPGIAISQTLALPYRPVAAEYSTALDRIIMIAANPNQLHIYNPASKTDVAVNLSKPPLSVSVSPDGMHAAVGHDGLISYVNLATQLFEKTLPASTTVASLALGTGYVYIPDTGSIRISTGALDSTVSVPGATFARLHPGGAGLYTIPPSSPGALVEVDVTNGPMGAASAGPYSGDYPLCGGLWFSPDGRRVYTGCATVFQANPSVPGTSEFSWTRLDIRQDGLYWATLAGTSQIRSLSESAATGRVALVPTPNPNATPAIADNQVFLYDNFLEPAGIFQLPGFTAGGSNFQSHAEQVFFNSVGTALYVVMQADSSSGLQNDFAVQIVPLTPTACAPAFGVSTATATAAGGLGSATIAAPSTCVYQAASDSTWLQIVSGGYGSGNGTLTYIARPNTGAGRTGTITVGNQTLTVTQQGFTPSSSLLAPLSYPVAGADYSKTFDKLVVIVSSPNELHVYDAASGSDQIVPLPKVPLCVSVSRDGLSAAVGMDGWISIVNLGSASITNTFQVFTDVHSILSGGGGFVYAFPQRSRSDLFSVDGTGVINAANATGAGRIPRLSASGSFFYLESSKWDITQGIAKPASPQPSFSNLSICGNFWLAEDGTRVFTACGTSFTTSDTASLDLVPNGSLANAPAVQWASESAKLHTTAVIPGVGSGVATADTFVQVYGDAALGYSGSLALPSFSVGSTPYAGHGRFVFWNKTADRLIVVQEADATANLASGFGVSTYALNTPAAGCTFSLGSASATFSTSGGSGSVSVSTGTACIWKASSNAPWITVAAGAVAFASNVVTYTVSPNLTNVARQGTLTIAGQTFTVMEAGAAPGLTVTKTHSGDFTAGQIGAIYTVMVNSVSGAPTSGTITVTDVLPAGLIANAIGGPGWNCTLATFSCNRTDIIAPGRSYPPIQVTVNVAANAPPSVTNTATVSGGGLPGPLSTSDLTTIQGSALTVSHIGNFTQGQPVALYTISVQNVTSTDSAGSVSVTDTLPAGLTATAIAGPGWACTLTTVSCSRSDSLPVGGSYPPITVTVSVAANGVSPVTNQAVLSGGLGAASATDFTNIQPPFADVSSTDLFLPAIDLLWESSITSGCQATPPGYCPGNNITLAQMAVFVVRSVMGNDNFTYTATPYFTDVPATHPFFKWIQKIQDLGIALPCAANQYCPDTPVSRGAMAVLIVRGRYGVSTPSNYPATPYFTDVGTNYQYFPWIQKMKQLGITSGCSATTYCPEDPVTRGQMAVFIMRGEFNHLLPATTPVVVWASPASASLGKTVTVTLAGQNTNFVAGVTQVNSGEGTTVSNITVVNGSVLTAQFAVSPGAALGPRSITVTTGSEEATLPNGFQVQP